jgi:hypothetical protein
MAYQRKDLTVVINTCDAYEDVLSIFFHAFNKYWPDCPYPVVINTESKQYLHKATVNNYISNNGFDDWGKRFGKTLDWIETEFVLVVYDDFILDDYIDGNRLIEIVEALKENKKASVAYLIDTKLELESKSDFDLSVVKRNVDFRLNSAPGIWRKNVLLQFICDGDNPWAWEAFGTYRTWDVDTDFLTISPGCSDIYSYDYSRGGAIYRGKWVREVIDNMEKKEIFGIDWEQRGFSSKSSEEKRSFKWKMNFIKTGWDMVGYKVFYFFISYIKIKFSRIFK